MNKAKKSIVRKTKNIIVLTLLMTCVWVFAGLAIFWLAQVSYSPTAPRFAPQIESVEHCGKGGAGFLTSGNSSGDGQVDATFAQGGVYANNLAVSDRGFIVNLSRDDVSNVTVSHEGIAKDEYDVADKITDSVNHRIEEFAQSKFGKNCFTMGIVQFALYESGERMTDFSDLTSVELDITVSGSVENAKDSYYAVFLKLDATTEAAVLEGNYAVLENVESSSFVGQKVSCRENGKSDAGTHCLLTIDADSDGIIFLMNAGSEKGGMGMLIVIVGVVLSLVLLIVIAQIFHSYKREKLKVGTHYDAKDVKKDVSNSEKDAAQAADNASSEKKQETSKSEFIKATPTAQTKDVPKTAGSAPKKPRSAAASVNQQPKLPTNKAINKPTDE